MKSFALSAADGSLLWEHILAFRNSGFWLPSSPQYPAQTVVVPYSFGVKYRF